MAIQIHGATGPYSHTDGPGWYGRNAQQNSRDTLLKDEQGMLTQLLKADPTQDNAGLYDQFQSTVRFSPDDSTQDTLAENALGFGLEELDQKGVTVADRVETAERQYKSTIETLLNDSGTPEVFQIIQPMMGDILKSSVKSHMETIDRNGNGKVDPEEAAAEALFQDDPVHALEAVGLNENEADNVDPISRRTVRDFLENGDSLQDGEIRPEERITAGVFGSQAKISTGKALDKIIADFNLQEKAGAFARAGTDKTDAEQTD
ncbi:MAG: hypothetical protein AB7P76_10800 [Candidatus Melainabacteria bacterium]